MKYTWNSHVNLFVPRLKKYLIYYKKLCREKFSLLTSRYNLIIIVYKCISNWLCRLKRFIYFFNNTQIYSKRMITFIFFSRRMNRLSVFTGNWTMQISVSYLLCFQFLLYSLWNIMFHQGFLIARPRKH